MKLRRGIFSPSESSIPFDHAGFVRRRRQDLVAPWLRLKNAPDTPTHHAPPKRLHTALGVSGHGQADVTSPARPTH